MERLTRWFVIVALVAGSAKAHAASLSGTVRYNGSRGTVSATTPILLFLFTTPSPGDEANPQQAVVNVNGGGFSYDVTAGTYYLAFALDLNGNGNASTGEPFSVYNSKTTFPGDPISVPGPSLTLRFDDTNALPGISGIATYTGSMGTVSGSMHILIQAFTDSQLTNRSNQDEKGSNGDRYEFLIFDHDPRYLRATFDANENGQYDPGEPFQIYNNKSVPPGDPVVASTTQTNINFTFGDENIGLPTPTPTPTSVPCTGDCNSDGQVTVNELIQMVNIALGNADISTCTAGDANHDGTITVNEIVAAVNNALNACTPQAGDLTGTWSLITGYAQGSPCAGCVGATLSLTQSGQSISGSFSGPFPGCPDGMLTGTVSGTVNNSQVSLTLTDMNCATPYSSFFTGTISSTDQMGGTCSDTNSVTGNWTASRPSS